MSTPLRTVPDDLELTSLLDGLPLPQLQVAEALAALGPTRLARLSTLLTGGESDEQVVVVAKQLDAAGLCRLDGVEVAPAPGLRKVFGRPLGLGLPLAEALPGLYADDVRRIARHLGLPALGRKEVTLGPVLTRLGEPGVIASLLAEAPRGALDELLTLAGCGDPAPMGEYDDEDGWDPDRLRSVRYREGAWPGNGGDGHSWARARGLVVKRHDDYRDDLPAGVALVLRGPDYRAPWEPERPAVPRRAAVAETDRAALVACQTWLRLTRLCGALLEEAARKPLPRRRSGELTAPELKRLATSLDATGDELRVLLALAKAGGLVVTDAPVKDPSRRLAWLEAEIPERAAILARQLCALTRPLDGFEPAPHPYYWSPPKPVTDVTGLRRSLLSVLRELPAGENSDLESVTPTVRWDAPRAVDAEPSALEALWGEATSLALIVNGRLSPVGRALVDADESRLVEVFTRLLPATCDEVVVTADLTATVVGLPTRHVSRVLDSLAVREADDTSTTWRFERSSVRRAFDDGGTLERVTADLTAVTRGPLPTALTRLIGDAARLHGHLVVSKAGSVIACDDPMLLTELQGAPVLAILGLRPLGPGMLQAETSLEHTLDILRDNGYLPIAAAHEASHR